MAIPSSFAVPWLAEPNHAPIHTTPNYTLYAGHLPPHSQTLVHTHLHPTIIICHLSLNLSNKCYTTTGVVYNSSPISSQKGHMFTQIPTPKQPYIHSASTDSHPALFSCIETSLPVRHSGPPAPPLRLVQPAPGVHARPQLADCLFGSGQHLVIRPRCGAELRATQTDGDRVHVRFVAWLGGGDAGSVQVQAPDGVRVEKVVYSGFMPGVFGFVLEGFDGGEAVCKVINGGEGPVEVAVFDLFVSTVG